MTRGSYPFPPVDPATAANDPENPPLIGDVVPPEWPGQWATGAANPHQSDTVEFWRWQQGRALYLTARDDPQSEQGTRWGQEFTNLGIDVRDPDRGLSAVAPPAPETLASNALDPPGAPAPITAGEERERPIELAQAGPPAAVPTPTRAPVSAVPIEKPTPPRNAHPRGNPQSILFHKFHPRHPERRFIFATPNDVDGTRGGVAAKLAIDGLVPRATSPTATKVTTCWSKQGKFCTPL